MPSKITPAATLARVQELHDGGNSFRKIAEILAAEGVPAAGPRSSWHHANVSWCLKEIGQRSALDTSWGLSPQLRARLAAQGEEIEGLTVAGMHRLGTGIQETVETELQAIQTTVAAQIGKVETQLQTIQAAAERQTALVRGGLGRFSMWVVVLAFVLGLGVSGLGWMIGQAMTRSLAGYQAEIAQAEARQATAEGFIVELENKTGGLGYVENEDGRWLVWRKGDKPFKNSKDQWVVKLKGN